MDDLDSTFGFSAGKATLKGWRVGIDKSILYLSPLASPTDYGLPRQPAGCLAMTHPSFVSTSASPANAPAKNPKRSDVFSRRGGATE